MYQYKVDDLSVGAHEILTFNEGSVLVAKLTLPSLMPYFWNVKVSIFTEGGSTQYNLGSEVGVVNLTPEPGFSNNCVQLINDPSIQLASLGFILKDGSSILQWKKAGDNVVPLIDSQKVSEFSVSIKMGSLPQAFQDQRIFIRIQGECTPAGLHTHTAWGIILIRKESLEGITLKWVII